MHVAIKLAHFMGAKTMLIIGMQHEPHKQDAHFYGANKSVSWDQNTDRWFYGYEVLTSGLAELNIQVLNISPDTYVPEELIPVDDHKNWINKRKVQNGWRTKITSSTLFE